jgi:phospho-N-acetylmuramoyl-pentapeptide-transferase
MLVRYLVPLSAHFTPFNVFRYPSFRMLMSGILALLLGMILGPWFIKTLRVRQHGSSNVREDTPEEHQKKVGTPTMGGGLVLFCVAMPTLLLADLSNRYVWFALLITLGYGGVGAADDYLKLAKSNSKGLSGRLKLAALTGVFVLAYALFGSHLDTHIYVPFDRHLNPDLDRFYPLLAWLVVVGTSNAVNITDGLDGLAIGPTIVSAVTLTVLAWVAGSVIAGFNIAHYLYLPHIEGAEELSVFGAAVAGAGIAFLWYNTYPASVFMGDVGALALGAGLGFVAVVVRQEIVALVMGGVFVLETASVMLQVASFKLTGKRVFRMAPIHHHFELKGWAEPKVIVRFWIISILLVLAGLATLKLR